MAHHMLNSCDGIVRVCLTALALDQIRQLLTSRPQATELELSVFQLRGLLLNLAVQVRVDFKGRLQCTR